MTLSKKLKRSYNAAAECWHGYKTTARMVGTVLKLGKKGKHNYRTVADARWGQDGYKTAARMHGPIRN